MELCSILKYDRSLFPGKAVFFYKTSDCDFIPLEAEPNEIQGSKAGFTEGFSQEFLPKNIASQDLAYCNPLIIEECYVPPNIEHVYCRFSLRVQANSLEPSMCNNIEVFKVLQALAKSFKDCDGYRELAVRYCKNILLGTWLWRNLNTGNTSIAIKTSLGNLYQIENTRNLLWGSVWPHESKLALEQLSDELLQALTDPKIFWDADVTAKIATTFCQEIYPSQRLIGKVDRGQASKQFSKVKCLDGKHAVSFNSVKVGAALQLIDDWWIENSSKRLRVHEYGADKELCIAQRPPTSELNFYPLFVNSENHLEELQKQKQNKQKYISHQIYYVFAVLIKGGMFQKKKKKEA